MPNTLVHIGINGFLIKSVSKKSNLFWIYLGCIISDIPWISKKFFELFIPEINGYDLQAYSIIQATLIFSIILSLSLSFLSKNILQTFIILSAGSILHLAADSLETKWANGVHFFAPLNWDLINFGIIWPNNIIIHVLGFFGLAFFVWSWKNIENSYPVFSFPTKRIYYFIAILFLYIFLPLTFINQVYQADNHFIQTLKNHENRIGKYVEMDRKKIELIPEYQTYRIKSFNKDWINLTNIGKINSSTISVKGKFIKSNLIEVFDYQENLGIVRDGASYIGLFLIFIFSVKILLKNFYSKSFEKIKT
ncbi:MAG: hypothetical protein IPM32_10820 [Ignavibacteriae bacterium]|nr:hypothetical protein [Ignavibacteriota bacterium]